MKDFVIYENKKKGTRVYIHALKKERGRKTISYAIRSDNSTGRAIFLGMISFNGGWRQYVTEFELQTIWSSGCKKKICEFEDMLNKKFRDRLKRK